MNKHYVIEYHMAAIKRLQLAISESCSLTYKDKEPGSTYNIQKIVVSVVKMLIKKFFSTEAFLTVSTPPFIYIHMNLVQFLISE